MLSLHGHLMEHKLEIMALEVVMEREKDILVVIMTNKHTVSE